MNNCVSFPVTDLKECRIRMLNWANRFSIFCFLDNHQYDFTAPAFECLLGAGSKRRIQVQSGNAFESLRQFYDREDKEWLFGHFGYDLKNETENLHSSKPNHTGFSDLHFFVPEIILQLDAGELKIYPGDQNAGDIYKAIYSCPVTIDAPRKEQVIIEHRIKRTQYIDIVEKLRQHILRGDCYEINFCQEFFAAGSAMEPLHVYDLLTRLSPNPFSVLYRADNSYCLCASPERYLKRTGKKIVSQPIKGTSRRDAADRSKDKAAKEYLLRSDKEKSENVMIVDLVRNDLSRICKPGSVKVEELFGVYSFPHVHQMISTVSGELEDGLNWIDCARATFPMGSMTGAPKKRVMELIEQYEQSRRGLFSGAIGYIKPGGDFDFNVVIRSMFYNAGEKYISFQAGSAITYHSDAAKEYEECMLKAEAMMKVLG